MTTATETTALEYIKTIGITNNGDNGRGFANPYSIAVSRDGRIYVLSRCDPARATAVRVGVQDIDENFLFEFSEGYGSGPGQFVLPVAIAFDSQERLYITDEYNHRVAIYSSEGKFLDQWGEHGSEPGKLNGPAGIAIDSNDNVYVADQHSHAISKFTAEGRFLNRFGREEDVTPLAQPVPAVGAVHRRRRQRSRGRLASQRREAVLAGRRASPDVRRNAKHSRRTGEHLVQPALGRRSRYGRIHLRVRLGQRAAPGAHAKRHPSTPPNVGGPPCPSGPRSSSTRTRTRLRCGRLRT